MNRLHSLTRWPLDLEKRLELATTDMDFAAVMRSIMGPPCELFERIHAAAFEIAWDCQNAKQIKSEDESCNGSA